MKTTKRIAPNKGRMAPVALDSPIVKEPLPLPYVHYPEHYGTFLCFSESEMGQKFFCECSRKAILNHFELNSYKNEGQWADKTVSSPLSSHFFPNSIALESLETDQIDSLLRFKPKLCHRCNLATPTLRYCHEMYGGNFKQYYGWYIAQTAFRIGLKYDLYDKYVENYTPNEYIESVDKIKDLRKIIESTALSFSGVGKFRGQIEAMHKEVNKLSRKLSNTLENITREEFGFRKIGEGNVSEMILTKIVQGLVGELDIVSHYRPAWLEGLELDVFVPSLNLGIEYQGQQHFYAVEAWGGVGALTRQQERDARKRMLCREHGVRLVEFDYTEPLERKYIKNKIKI